MKIRIGFGLGTHTHAGEPDRFAALVDGLEARGFDSLWLSERLSGPAPDPLAGLAFAAGRTRRLKLGTSVQVLPGRNPVVLAKAWATLDRLSGGRALPAFGLGVADPHEQQAFGVERSERAAWFDEALPLLRKLWASDGPVAHDGPRFHLDGVAVQPKPVQQPLEVWLGGIAPSELRRVGRLGDGWLPSFCTAADVEVARPEIERVAAEHDRAIDGEHWGALIAYSPGPLPDRFVELIARRRPGVDPAELVPVGFDALRRTIDRFVAVGTSKFVVVPALDPPDWAAELDALASAVLPLQT